MNRRIFSRGRILAALLGLCLTVAFAPPSNAQGYPQYEPDSPTWAKWAGCKNIPKYPGYRLIADSRGAAYLIQAVNPPGRATEERIRAWFAQNLHGWTFYATPTNRYPTYMEFRDPRSSHFVRIETHQMPVGIRYKCF